MAVSDPLAATPTSRLRNAIRSALAKTTRFRRLMQIGFVLGGISLAGIAEVASNSLDGTAKAVATTLWVVGLALAFLGGVVLALFEQDSAVALALAQEAEAKESSLRSAITAKESQIDAAATHIEWLARIYALSVAHREFTERLVTEGYTGPEAFVAQVAGLLDLLVFDKETFFGIRDERWNFALYVLDNPGEFLDCIVCRRPHASEAEGPHRRWKSGEGHVGLAFERKREFVEVDLADPEKSKFFATSVENVRDYDADRYRSIASIPLMIADDVFGVLVATSDVPGRFRPDVDETVARDPVEALRLTAATIAIAAQVAHMHRRLGREHDGEKEDDPNSPEGS